MMAPHICNRMPMEICNSGLFACGVVLPFLALFIALGWNAITRALDLH
jgi:hypothetical protein